MNPPDRDLIEELQRHRSRLGRLCGYVSGTPRAELVNIAQEFDRTIDKIRALLESRPALSETNP